MRSFAVIAGFAAAANAYAYGYPEAYNTSSLAYPSATPAYPEYAAESSKPAEYPAESTKPAEYPAESTKPAEYPSYPESSKAPEYPVYTTEVVTGLTTVCPEPTTITYAGNTYTVKSSTTLIVTDCTTTTTYPVAKPTTHVPVNSEAPPAHPSVVVPYPSKNATVPAYTPHASSGVVPSSTKPATPEFTGAAGKVSAGVFAVAGALLAFAL